ncbi:MULTISPECIES: glycosyltransferase [unclassified Frigoribacterium]|uniref:glycosyltransferase n=1 Tax=unclassified Frigoribacterium TaxID=2627005 RepID=UPI0009EAA4AB|nr:MULTISPECIES: glycosyltransferase [unclassified Frigoribacterium]
MTSTAARPLVGWYVHHHGAGHRTRFSAVRPQLDADVVVFSSLAAPADLPADTTWVELERDDAPTTGPDGVVRHPADASPTVGGLLHWAPVAHPGHTARLGRIAAAIAGAAAAGRPLDAMVVDVSVEVTLFVRLLGVEVVVVSQPGDRTDEPHRLAYDAASRVIAPWPAGTHDSSALDRIAGKVRWVGGISRQDGRRASVPTPAVVPGSVLFVGGAGGSDHDDLAAAVARAARATPGTTWSALGLDTWVDDPWAAMASAEVVVTWAGQNTVADLAALGAHAVVVPQTRPFDEQLTTARALDRAGLAVVASSWPADDEWPWVIERARSLQPDWSAWQVEGAAARAAAVVAEVAGRGARGVDHARDDLAVGTGLAVGTDLAGVAQ